MPPDDVVRKCDLVCKYLGMEGRLKTVSFINSELSQEELDRRFRRIIKCLDLVENGGYYIGATRPRKTIEEGTEFYYAGENNAIKRKI